MNTEYSPQNVTQYEIPVFVTLVHFKVTGHLGVEVVKLDVRFSRKVLILFSPDLVW